LLLPKGGDVVSTGENVGNVLLTRCELRFDDRDELRDEDEVTGEFTIAMETCWAFGGTRGTMGTMWRG
jgi:hypothetical protein